MKVVRGDDIDLVPASHEDAEDPGVLKRVLASSRDFQSGHVQMLNWSVLRSGKSFQRHYHENMQEVFVILQGKVTAEVELKDRRQSCELASGDALIVEPEEIHSMMNSGPDDVVYIVFGIASGRGGRTVVVD
jgi:mannose-6-phosphate isomerase-like protein (cupin superfamily)